MIKLIPIALLIVFFFSCVSSKDYKELQTKYEDVLQAKTNLSQELTACEAKWPRYFHDESELRDWIKKNLTPDETSTDKQYSRAVQLQEKALNEGFILSACVDQTSTEAFTVFMMAVAGHKIYWWLPQEGELYPYPLMYYEY